MTVSYVEREQATPETHAFYDEAEDHIKVLLNIFKVFGHYLEYGNVFTDLIMAIPQIVIAGEHIGGYDDLMLQIEREG